MTDSEEYILVNKLCDEIDNHNIANIKKIIKNNKYHLYDKLVLTILFTLSILLLSNSSHILLTNIYSSLSVIFIN